MLVMVVRADITAPSVAVFVRGTHLLNCLVSIKMIQNRKPSLKADLGLFTVAFSDSLLDR